VESEFENLTPTTSDFLQYFAYGEEDGQRKLLL